MSINININAKDINYRYKMNKLTTRQTGRGGNSHTILENLDVICTQINTVPEIILSYIGNILGCQIVQSNNSIKGHYTTDKIQDIIFNFINFATLCQKCNIPELTPEVTKNNKDSRLNMMCSACGYVYELI
jgi:translation initiation factor 2 beta subunit (eIF-2beta)/eIF-5